MDENSIHKLLAQSFPKSNKEEWRLTATAELNGNEPFSNLLWKDDDNLEFFPYYEKEDVGSLQYLRAFDLQPASEIFSANRSWLNLAGETVTDELTANKKALQHLANGADGVLWTLNKNGSDLFKLFSEIQLQYCLLSFQGNLDEKFLASLIAYFKKTNLPLSTPGQLFWNKLPEKSESLYNLLKYERFRSFGILVSQSTAAQEIHHALLSGVKLLSQFQGEIGAQQLADRIAFSLPLHNNFLGNVTKLKTLRLLWYQVVRSFGCESFLPHHLHIHCRSEKWTQHQYEPHANMLKATIAGMAAITGGCDSLTIYPEENDNIMMSRIARNVSNVLREESYLDKVADPLAGAYALDVMVDAMARKVWSLFQSTMKK
jgi:methylmalonyl-CoA mutase